MSISMIGLDTAKSVFQIHGVNETGKVEIKRKLSRSELIAFFEKQESCTVVMEACGAAHHWARMLTGLGHTVKLIAAEAIKPFVKKGKKNVRPMPQRSAKPPPGPMLSSCRSRPYNSRVSLPCTRLDHCWSSNRQCWRTPCVAWPQNSASSF